MLELLTLLPYAGEVDRSFYADVWVGQELRHGEILDDLHDDLGVRPSAPDVKLSNGVRLLGLLSKVRGIHEVTRFVYYLTGAMTEKSAVVAYNKLFDGLTDAGEIAIAKTIIAPIKRQEPGHFAFYRMSATKMLQEHVLKPWQLRLVRLIRSKAFQLVGVHHQHQKAEFGAVMTELGLTDDLDSYVRTISIAENDLVWARDQGMAVPPYVLAALREALAEYRLRELRRGSGQGFQQVGEVQATAGEEGRLLADVPSGGRPA